ncbi:hypothetical protein P9166_13690 [Lactococcus lactis]|nr:hypothetical protein P9166_13690 [Lactococcus lactis]
MSGLALVLLLLDLLYYKQFTYRRFFKTLVALDLLYYFDYLSYPYCDNIYPLNKSPEISGLLFIS